MKKLYCLLITLLLLSSTTSLKASAQSACLQPPTPTTPATLITTIPENGTYAVWARINPSDTTNNSFLLQIDSDCLIRIGGSTSLPANTWSWVNYRDGTTSNVITVPLTKGDHVLRMYGEKPRVKIDRLILTSDSACIPSGTGDNCNPVATSPTLQPCITPTPVQPAPNVFKAVLTGSQQVPGVAADATGISYLVLNPAQTAATVSLSICDHTLSSPQTAAHIHGPAITGVNAAALINLPQGSFSTTIQITTSQLQDLKNGTLYINIHTNNFPGGEIRGQYEGTITSPTPTIVIPTQTPFPTVTPNPQSPTFTFNVLLHGIGKGGDSVKSDASGNNTPISPQKPITLELVSENGTLVNEATGIGTFNPQTGSFSVVMGMQSAVPDGAYRIKIRSPWHLKNSLPGFITISEANSTGTITLADFTLIAGDSTDDNRIDILDYNILSDCYSDTNPAKSCTTIPKKRSADLNDDGRVDGLDLNLFIRNTRVRTGQ